MLTLFINNYRERTDGDQNRWRQVIKKYRERSNGDQKHVDINHSKKERTDGDQNTWTLFTQRKKGPMETKTRGYNSLKI